MRAGGRARTDATHVVAAVRTLNRIELVVETLRAALTALAAAVPDWLAAHLSAEQAARYAPRADAYRMPAGEAKHAAVAVQVGRDGFALLQAIHDTQAPGWLRDVPAVEVLRTVWIQHYHRAISTSSTAGTEVARRENDDLPPGQARLVSPYDTDARHGIKRGMGWTGYKVHFTETCDTQTCEFVDVWSAPMPGTPHLITTVATTDATITDVELTAVVHQQMARQGLTPAEHLVDAGYVSAEVIPASRAEHGIDRVGPVAADTAWQTRDPDAFDASHFRIDWDAQQVICPSGAVSTTWRGEKARATPVIKVGFRVTDCGPCPLRPRCTTATSTGRKLTLRHRAQHEALDRLRREQATGTWKQRYTLRAGVEGTTHQAVARTGIRHSRYRGLPQTHLAHVLAATAINLVRLDAWWTGTPPGHTRTSHLTTLDFDLAA